MPGSRTFAVGFTLCLVLVIGGHTVCAQQSFRNIEYRLKAGYLAYFGSLVTWPAEPKDEFVIAVLGPYPFNERESIVKINGGYRIEIIRVVGRQVRKAGSLEKLHGVKIEIQRFESLSDFEKDGGGCHILFVTRELSDTAAAKRAFQSRLAAALDRTKRQPVLVVTEAEDKAAARQLVRQGAVISFWNDANTNRVRMFINREEAESRKLTINSQLLKIAEPP
jgi:hypothetical protein